MPLVPTRSGLVGSLTSTRLLNALIEERDYANAGVAFTVTGARLESASVVIGIERRAGRRTVAIEETLEGCRAVWGAELQSRGDVLLVNTDTAEIVLRFTTGALPTAGERILLYQRDFLTPLVDLWQRQDLASKAMRATKEKPAKQLYPDKPLPVAFSELRKRQGDAVLASLFKRSLIVGPPGTGKTHTIGAMIGHLLTRFEGGRILLVGPTNVATDTALIAADEWLKKLDRPDLRSALKRIGSRFDTRKFRDRSHLLAPGVAEAASQVAILELEEPPRSDIEKYVRWKEQLEKARAALRVNVLTVALPARLVALTTASSFIWNEYIAAAGPWNFIICDEASQVFAPAALMLTTFASQAIFAGDPNQLSPIVQNDSINSRDMLASTAFGVIKSAKRVHLNEQSRMSHSICKAVATTFYEGDLKVCSKAERDSKWQKARSAYFINGRKIPRIIFDDRGGEKNWSAKYNGPIRFDSAKLIEKYVAAFLGSYADAKDILVLTPFRAQRTLVRAIFKGDSLREVGVSTVHKSQGSESKIVIFDPVDAGSPFLNSEEGKRLINVALSRAQAHAIFIINQNDLTNPWIRNLRDYSASRGKNDSNYASGFFVNIY